MTSRNRRRIGWAVLAALASLAPIQAGAPPRLDLRENWLLQSAAEANAAGEILSSAQFKPEHWYTATIPSTVMAAQVANGEFKDLFYSDNLRRLAPAGNPYGCSWWYRTEFRLPAGFSGRRTWLHLNGVNTRANVWLNGRRLAGADEIAGSYRLFELDATPHLAPDGLNVLAIEVFAPTDKDFAINFVDWTPTPPDKNMGLWREVYLTASGPVRLRHPSAATHFPGDTLERAELTVRTELYNDTGAPVEGVVRGRFGDVRLEQKITLAPHEARPVVFAPAEFPQLRIDHPELWWPAGLGAQKLYRLTMEFEAGGAVSDSQTARFGIREITGELYGNAPRMGEVYDNNGGFVNLKTDTRPFLLRVNRQPILIRGAGWAPEMLLRTSAERLRAEFSYVRDMHLNAIRLEGKLEGDEFFDLADEMGILVLAGFCCGDRFEQWSEWGRDDYTITSETLRTQILRLRGHPSLALWMAGSDNAPPADVEQLYRRILSQCAWPNPIVSSASSKPTTVSGASGVKMTGPYDYVPPSYWLLDKDHFGGAFGFNTETSPGASVAAPTSLKKFLPKDQLWPAGSVWNLHAGAGDLNGNLKHFNESMGAMYGPPAGLDDYTAKAQAMAYDGERAMFEAYGRNKYSATGVIQWMLNNGWPSNMWHLYDYYLQPAGGYFGTKKACEPLHIQYSYDDDSVFVVNSVNRSFAGLTAEAAMYDFGLHRLFFRRMRLNSAADGVQRLFVIPADQVPPGVHFVALRLTDPAGRLVSNNFYWLPMTRSQFDWAVEHQKDHPYYTAVTKYEDLSQLNQLRKVRLDATAVLGRPHDGAEVSVRIKNPSSQLAFQIRLALVDADSGGEILPVLWEDNYVSLLPGESRTLAAHYDSAAPGRRLRLEVNGWNIEAAAAPVTADRLSAAR